MTEKPSDPASPSLSATVQLPRRSMLLSINQVAELIASQLAPPEGNRRGHRRSALLAAWPALAAREQAALHEHEPQRRRRLEALAHELDAMTDADAGAAVQAEVERRIAAENVGAWSWRIFDAVSTGRLLVRLRDGVRVPPSRSTTVGHAAGWISAGDLAEWLEREGFEVTHVEVAGADPSVAPEPAAPVPWSAPIGVGQARVDAILTTLQSRGVDVQRVPLGLKTQLRREFIESRRDLAFTPSTFDGAWKAASADGRLAIVGKSGYSGGRRAGKGVGRK